MLLIIRSLLLVLILFIVTVIGSLYCLFRPRHRDNVHLFAHLFAATAPIIGLKVIVRQPQDPSPEPCIYLSNHQNNYDLFTLTKAVPKGTVSIGKKSILWMPLFGQIYWLSGNILIDRANRARAFETLAQTAVKIKEKCLSIWIFPEGTRSRGRGLLPFKAGAFHTAIAAQVPLVPILASSQDHIHLNRWDNGVVIVDILPPISTAGLDKNQAKVLAEQTHQQMAAHLAALNDEAQAMMQAKQEK